MKENVLCQVEVEDVVFYAENQYNKVDRKKYLEEIQYHDNHTL